MKKYLLQLLLMLAVNYSYGVPPTQPYRILLVTNINSCTFCNHTTGTIIKNDPVFKNVNFLLSPEEATAEQAKLFLEEMMQRPCAIILDSMLYAKIASTIAIFKMPHVVVLDSINNILFKTPIDSVRFYRDVLQTFAPARYHTKVISNSRIKKIIGWRTLNKIDDHYIVTGWQSSDRMFVYNKATNRLDSVFITNNDSLIKALIEKGDGHDIDIARMKKVYKDYDLPYSLIQFGTNAIQVNDHIASSIDLLYVDPDKPLDTITSEWLSFVFTYKPSAKQMKIIPLKDWESDSANGYIFDHYKLDYQSYREINDSTWLIGGKEDNRNDWDPENNPRMNDTSILLFNRQKDPDKGYKHEQLFYYFTKSAGESKLHYANKYIMVSYDSIYTFDREKMNEPGYMFQYTFEYPYLYYNASPFIYNDTDKSLFDIRMLNKNITWIHTLNTDEHVVRILVQEKKKKILYVLWKHNYQLLKTVELGDLPSKNNMILEGENIYFMNKEGQIVEMEKR
jgi:hypothetical protein